MYKKIISALILLALSAYPAKAQLNLTYTTFTPGQTVSSAQFTANFTAISANALNRTGGIMAGTLTMDGTLDVNSTFIIGSGNVQPFDSTGKIQSISSTYFASLSAANLTGVLEASITDGALLARVGSAETISGAWNFSTPPTMAGTNISAIPEANISDGAIFARLAANETVTGSWTLDGSITHRKALPIEFYNQTDGATNEKWWAWVNDGSVFQLTAYNDTLDGGTSPLVFTRSGITVSTISLTGTAIQAIGNTAVTGTFSASGGVTLQAGLAVTGAVTASSTLAVTGNTTIGGTLTVTGAITGPLSATYADGTVGTPAGRFTSDADTGFYRVFEDGFAISAGGGRAITFGATLINIPSTHTLQLSNATPNTSGAGTIGTSSALFNAMYALSFLTTSDRRAKMDISEMDKGIEFIDALKPVNYRFVKDPTKLRYGFIAQELQTVGFGGVDSSDPKNLTVNYSEFIAPMVKGMQELHEEIHLMERVNKLQSAQITFLVERIKELEKGYGTSRKAE